MASILKQSYKEYEVLLVDNGSTDNSIEECKKWQYSNITILNTTIKGAHSARLEGFRKSRGEYLVFVDADDELPEGALMTLHNAISKDYDIVKGREIRFDFEGRVFPSEKYDFEEGEISSQTQYMKLMYMNQISPYLHGGIYKKSLFTEEVFLRCIDNNVVIGEDWITNLLISKGVKKVLVLNDVVYHYFINNNSTMSSSVLGWDNGKRCARALESFMQNATHDIRIMANTKAMAGNVMNQFVPELCFRMDAYKMVRRFIKDKDNYHRLCQIVPARYMHFIEILPLFYIYCRTYAILFKWKKLKGKTRKIV